MIPQVFDIHSGSDAHLVEGLEVGPAQADAALLALDILDLIVTSGQMSYTHLPSPV